MRILIIKTSSFGDIIQLFPALALFHKHHPDATVDFVINPEFAPLLEFAPCPIRKTIIFERKKLGSITGFLPNFIKLVREIRKEKYDYAVDYQGLFRNAVIAGVAKADVKAGFASPREKISRIFYNRLIPVSSLHAVERYGELTKKLFSLNGELVQMIAPEQKHYLDQLPELPEPYAVLIPGSRWQSKHFPPELFRQVADKLHSRFPELHFIAVGSAAESGIAGATGENVINLAGKTSIGGLLELLRRAVLVIGNDSGPLHAAAAFGIPVFGFYGASIPERSGPWGKNCHVFSSGAKCCGCLKKRCPDNSYRCLTLDAGVIAESIIKRMEEKA